MDAVTIQQRIEFLNKIDPENLEFDDIIIDEAQDFDNKEILFFKAVSELTEGHFLIFYDINQLMTTHEVPRWISESECRLVLTKNCRNTYEIACTAYNVIDVALNQKISMIHGDKTTILFAEKNPLTELERIVKYYLKVQGCYDADEITILSMKATSTSLLANVKQINGIRLCRESREKNAIFFTTAKKFKGLESKVIIAIDIDENCFIDEETKRVFYVACSRATHNLTLFVYGDNEKIKQIANSIEGAKLSGKGKIAVKTQSIPFQSGKNVM